MIDVANDDRHGYDQVHRNSPNYDCSSLVATALNKAGFPVSVYSWTGNLLAQLLACNFTILPANSVRKRGDIFLAEKHHVVMCVDANTIVHASINENGKTKGGKSGDQTGKEICTRSFYTPSYGWGYHLRYIGADSNSTNTIKSVKARKHAEGFNKEHAGVYTVTASMLNVRNGAGTIYKKLVTIPRGTKVRCYGYYSVYSSVRWLYVQFVYLGVEYTGFCSSNYLLK